jgi:chemotaxis signal transduction protein
VNPDHVQQVLEERARALARAPDDQADGDEIELVVLTVGAERYGIDVRLIREVRPLAGLAPVPGTPEHWAGLVNLRGSLCPVLSLARYLRLVGGGPDAAAEDGSGVLVVVTAPFTAALLVDAAAEVRRCPPAALRALGPADDRSHAAVKSVTGDLLQVLDPATLLADPTLVVGREAGEPRR